MSIQPIATLNELIMHSDKWLTVKEVASILGVHPHTIRRWSAKGKLKCVRHPVSNFRLFLISDLWEIKKEA